MIDDTCATPSSQEVLDSKVWSSELNQFAWSMYLKNIKGDVPKYAAPIRETDFSQLPATYTSVGTLDPYRDETINYVQALAQAGVPVEFHLYQAVIMNLNLSRQMHLLVNNPKRRRYKL